MVRHRLDAIHLEFTMTTDWSLIFSALAIALIFPISVLSLVLTLAQHQRLAIDADQDHAIAGRFTDGRDLQQFEDEVFAERERQLCVAQARYVQYFRGAIQALDPRERPAYQAALRRTEARLRDAQAARPEGVLTLSSPTDTTAGSAAPGAQVRRIIGGRVDRPEET